METHDIPTSSPLTPAQIAALGSKQRMIVTTAKLLQRQGFHATGLQQVVEEASAPRGSIYHHFPGGKDELAIHALRVAAAEMTRTIEHARRTTDTPGDLVRRLGRSLARWLTESAFCEGCPVSTVALEVAPAHDELTAACAAAYAEWTQLFAGELTDVGVAVADAHELATLVVAGLEGALLLARANRSTTPLEQVANRLGALVDAEANAVAGCVDITGGD